MSISLPSLFHEYLLGKKNLLAFSSGVDSSALFFLLLEAGLSFDIALVNYGVREEAEKEEAHAYALAEKYGIRCFTTKAPLFKSHFEAEARKFRYGFFEETIDREGYDTLLTAHQLNDQLEWLLMRLSKGAGVSELIGLEEFSERSGYTIVRPLLGYSKEDLIDYLNNNAYPYFIDKSNVDEKYERNYIRKHFSDAMIARYKDGIKRSFSYLREDKKQIEEGIELCAEEKELIALRLHTKEDKVRAVDITLKKLGYLLSAAQRNVIAAEDNLVIGGKWAIVYKEKMLYIAPYRTMKMPKTFKEACRIAQVPVKIRPYCFEEGIKLSFFTDLC